MEPVDITFQINSADLEQQAQAVVDSILSIGSASQQTADMMSQEEAAQASLLQLFSDGTIAADLYAEAQRRLTDSFSNISNSNVSDQIDNLNNSLSSASASSSDLSGQIQNLPGPLGSATSGVGNLTKASLRFIATPIGLFLALVTGALMALTSWFNRSEDGQNAMRKGTAYFQAVLDQFLKIVDKVGEALYDAFDNPKTAVKNLWEFIKQNLMNRVQALGEMFRALGTIISSGFTDGFDDFGNAFLKGTTGIDKLTDKAKNFANEMGNAVDKAVELSKVEDQLEKDKRAFLKEEQELLGKIDELKQKSPKQAIKLEEELQKKKEGFLNTELKLHQDKMALSGDTSKSQLDKEAQLQADLIALQNEGAKNRREISSSASKDYEKKENEAQKAREKLNQAAVADENRLNGLLIAAMEEGTAKRIAQVNFDYDKEIDAIDKKLKEVEKLEKSAKKDGQFSKEDQTNVDKIKSDLSDARTAALFEKNYKQTEIEREAAKVTKALWQDVNANFRSELQNNLLNVQDYYTKLKEEAKKTMSAEEFKQFEFSANLSMTFDQTNVRQNQKLKEIDYEQEIDTQRQRIRNRSVLFESDRQKKLLQIEKDYNKKRIKVLEQTGKAEDKLNANLLKQDNEIIDLEIADKAKDKILEIAGYADDLGNAFAGVNDQLSTMFSVASQVGSGVAQMLSGGPAGWISGGISLLTTALSFFKEKSEEEVHQENLEKTQQMYERINRSLERQLKLLDEAFGIGRLEKFSDALTQAHRSIGNSVSSIYDYFEPKSGDKNNMLYSIVVAANAWKNTVNSINNLSLDRYIRELEATDKMIEKMYFALESNLLSGYDKEILEKNLENLEKYRDELKGTIEEYSALLTGTSFDSLTESIVSGFKEGKRAAIDFADDFEEMMRTAVIQALKTNALEGPLRDWYLQFAKLSEDGLTGQEIEYLRSLYNNIIETGNSYLEDLEKITGVSISDKSSSEQTSTKRGFETMTQDQASELNGRFTDLQMSGQILKLEALKQTLAIQQIALYSGSGSDALQNLREMSNRYYAVLTEIRDMMLSLVNTGKQVSENTALLDKTNSLLNDIKKGTDKI